MSPRWQDHYTRKAQAAGYPARSIFKLEEVQARMKVIQRGMRAVDLGCSPGSWSRYLVEQGVTRLVGVDLQPPTGIPGEFLAEDVFTVAPSRLREALGGPADLLVSDMAPSTMGHPFTDHVRQVELARRALDLAVQVLRPGGNFVCKVFEGQEAAAFVADVKKRFEETRRIRPDATRKQSVEFFVAAVGFKGTPPAPATPA